MAGTLPLGTDPKPTGVSENSVALGQALSLKRPIGCAEGRVSIFVAGLVFVALRVCMSWRGEGMAGAGCVEL